jgi:hypothetical protein
MSRPKSPISVRMTGTYFGIKVNTSSKDVRNAWRAINRRAKMSRSTLLRDLTKILKNRLELRIPALRRQLVMGVRDARGTRFFEESSHGTHQPHRQIRNPLTRIINNGATYRVSIKGDKVKVDMSIHGTRRRAINFHNDMKKVPRISTVWSRLDATCLPFVKDGHRDKVIQRWLEYSQASIKRDLQSYFLDRKRAVGI